MSRPPQQEQPFTCAWCVEDLQHCHGTAIIGGDGTHACSDDPQCTLEVDEHWFVAHHED